MKENDPLRRLRDGLLAQDTPPSARASAHQKTLFAKIHRRMQMEKALVGAGYCVLFLTAFCCWLRADRAPDAAAAFWWSAASMHLLLWFLVFFLWRLERLICQIPPSSPQTGSNRRERAAVFICALAVCAFGTALLGLSAGMPHGLKADRVMSYVLWAPVFFLFWYPFGIASAAARLWLKFRELELQMPGVEAAAGCSSAGSMPALGSKSNPSPE